MDFLNESSFDDLFRSSVRAFPKTTKRQHAVDPIVIEELRWTPFKGMKTLFIKGHARNEDKHYNTLLLFKNVDYSKNDIRITGSDGLIHELGKLSLENTDILVRCNCADFNWRFNFYNHTDKSLYGRKRAKYEGSIGPPANPSHLPGMCKHLMKTVYVLRDSGIFVD